MDSKAPAIKQGTRVTASVTFADDHKRYCPGNCALLLIESLSVRLRLWSCANYLPESIVVELGR